MQVSEQHPRDPPPKAVLMHLENKHYFAADLLCEFYSFQVPQVAMQVCKSTLTVPIS